MQQIERYRGSLLGLAVGDALGTTLEFHRLERLLLLTIWLAAALFDCNRASGRTILRWHFVWLKV